MNSSKYRFTLDMHMAQSQVSLPVVLNDTARILYISLSDGGKIYYIADGCLALLRIKRPTGTRIEQFCLIEDNISIVYDFAQFPQTAVVAGVHECEVTLYGSDDKVITTARFTMVVSARVIDDSDVVLDPNDWTMLDGIAIEEAKRQVAFETAISEAGEATNRANDIAEKLEQAKANGEFKGEKGDVGAAGVFVGPEAPTEDQPLWVDTDDSGTIKYQDPETGEWKSTSEKSSGGGDTAVVPDSLPNPHPLTVDGIEYDGSKAVQVFTGEGKSVLAYGAKGDGSTDDTAAFQNALAENRIVFVPEGTYILNGTLLVEENCCLELSQATVLKFTQTDKNCIAMQRLASIKGNHATVIVPYGFTANAIDASTTNDNGTGNTDVPPFTKWDPQWKMSRYITDLNICKPDSRGFHYSVNGECNGTAVYVNANQGDTVGYLWGVNMSGLRIAGAFNYGIHLYNVGSGWNHDMRVEAVIDACKIGVLVENCHYARIAATIQPRQALASDGTTAKSYAEQGIKLVASRGIDLSSCRVWDWSKQNNTTGEYITLFKPNNQYQHVALFGNCRDIILDDYLYYAQSTYDIRELIYTDTPSNFDSMKILQEPIDRWFKVKAGVPYFLDRNTERQLMTPGDLDAYFDTDIIKKFTDVLPTATDGNGNVFNGIGYIKRGYYVVGMNGNLTENAYHGATGFIPINAGDTLYVHGITIPEGGDGQSVFVIYDSNYTRIMSVASNNAGFWDHSHYYFDYTALEDGFKFTVRGITESQATAYIRFGFVTTWLSSEIVMASVNEEIKYTAEGFLGDGVQVKGESVILTSPSGYAFKITVGDDGVLSAERSVNDV